MFIRLNTIAKEFGKYQQVLCEPSHKYCISGFSTIKTAHRPLDPHYLYIAFTWQQAATAQLPPDTNVLIIEKTTTALPEFSTVLDPMVNYLIIRHPRPMELYHEVEDYFYKVCTLGIFAESLLNSLFSETGIQSMIDKVYPAFENPIMVFDAASHLIAANWEEVKKTPYGNQLIDSGSMPERVYDFMNLNNHIHERVKRSERPLHNYVPELGYEQLICTIDTQKNMGYLVVDYINRPIAPLDETLLYILKEAIDQQLKKDEFIRNSKGFHYEYFLKDLLDRKIAIDKQNFDRLNYTESEFRGLLYCLVVETARTSSTLNQWHIRNEFETHFPYCKTLIYNGEIIVLFTRSDFTQFTQKDYDKIHCLCEDHGIYAGISNCFDQVTEIYNYYKQALRAIEIGICERTSPGLFIYGNYYRQHLANIFGQKESLKTFCHPVIKHLIRYDKEQNTDLARTLYTYLIHERNASAAAEALDLHRNTLIYRLKKIDALVTVNYEDYEERQYLILSYQMNQ